MAHEAEGFRHEPSGGEIHAAALLAGKVNQEAAPGDGEGLVEDVPHLHPRRRQPQVVAALARPAVQIADAQEAVGDVAHVLEPDQVQEFALRLLEVGVGVGEAADAGEQLRRALGQEPVGRLKGVGKQGVVVPGLDIAKRDRVDGARRVAGECAVGQGDGEGQPVRRGA